MKKSGMNYGQYKYRLSKELGDHEPEEIMSSWLFHEASGTPVFDARSVESAISIITQERRIMNGEGVHLFISKDCADVTRNSVRNLTEPEMTDFVPDKFTGILYVEGEEPSLFECVGLGNESYVRLNLDEYGIFTSHAIKGKAYERDHTNMTETEESVMLNRMRLLYGVFMMMKTFPEMLADGPPEGIKHPAWYRRLPNKKHLGVERVRGTVAPHIRSGHFRVLRSAYYKKKRGQAVFVKATMVKGKAKHDKEKEKTNE